MNKCKTCRHWKEHRSDDWGTPAQHVGLRDEDSELVEPEGTMAYCMSPMLRFYERPADGGAAVMDGSQYWAALITTADFGCINHERDTAWQFEGQVR